MAHRNDFSPAGCCTAIDRNSLLPNQTRCTAILFLEAHQATRNKFPGSAIHITLCRCITLVLHKLNLKAVRIPKIDIATVRLLAAEVAGRKSGLLQTLDNRRQMGHLQSKVDQSSAALCRPIPLPCGFLGIVMQCQIGIFVSKMQPASRRAAPAPHPLTTDLSVRHGSLIKPKTVANITDGQIYMFKSQHCFAPVFRWVRTC